MAKTGTVVDVNRMMSSGTMYTYVLVAGDDGAVESLRGNAASSSLADLAFAQFGQKVSFEASGQSLQRFSINWADSARPWEGDVRMPGNKAS